jgi:CBS domain-containing protein
VEHPAPSLQRGVASDVMNAPVLTVAPQTSVHDAARLLLAHGISAAPVVDDGELLGMVSEGDLIGRNAQDRLAGHDWWLTLLAQADPARVQIDEALRARPVRDVMHSPVITAEPDTPLHEIAEMMQVHRIKRLPVMRQGRIVGIVSRADLLRVVANLPTDTAKPAPSTGMLGALMSLFAADRPVPEHAPPPATPDTVGADAPPAAASAGSFVSLAAAARASRRSEREAAAQATHVEEQRRVCAALQQHLDAAIWQSLLAAARAAAERGETEFEMLRFPSAVCSDRGRKIDVGEDGWPETLRGEPAELYDRWERELRPGGFGLAARIMDYPEGRLGDVGLFLTWRN